MGEQFLKEPIETYIFNKLSNMKEPFIIISTHEIQSAVGGINRIPQCCNIMRRFISGDDEILPNNYVKDGKNFSIKYFKHNH
ncbi:MAG: hypothetical protein M0R40_10450 [Firmicutes bacterium]|nr:hypothetical protein [Bacillota bacterium]